jgi:hypothetical protein
MIGGNSTMLEQHFEVTSSGPSSKGAVVVNWCFLYSVLLSGPERLFPCVSKRLCVVTGDIVLTSSQIMIILPIGRKPVVDLPVK